jgi:hypothetical protein
MVLLDKLIIESILKKKALTRIKLKDLNEKRASVLIPLIDLNNGEGTSILFTERSSQLSSHAGIIYLFYNLFIICL